MPEKSLIPPIHNPPINKFSIPLPLGYSQELVLGHPANPLPIVPKLLTDNRIFPISVVLLCSPLFCEKRKGEIHIKVSIEITMWDIINGCLLYNEDYAKVRNTIVVIRININC